MCVQSRDDISVASGADAKVPDAIGLRSLLVKKSFSRAFAVAAAGVSVLALSAPAAAQGGRVTTPDRNRQQSAPQQAAASRAPAVSRGFQTAYQPVNTAITAQNWAAADGALAALKAAASSPYERFLAAHADFRIANGLRNDARVATAATAMVDSNGAPATEMPVVYAVAAQTAYRSRDFAAAAARAERAQQLGATEPALGNIALDALFRSNQTDAGLARYRALLAAAQTAGRPLPEDAYSITAAALQAANRNNDLIDVLVKRAVAYPTAFNFRAGTQVFLQNRPEDRGLSIDGLRLLTAANAMNNRNFWIEYGRNMIDDAAPNEALQVVTAARTAGVVTASDRTFSEIETLARGKLAEDRASLPGSETRARARPDAQLATRVGDAYLSYGDYAKAEEFYRLAQGKTGADAGLINTRVGIARFRAGNYARAIEAFNAVQGARQPLAQMWAALAQSKLTPAATASATPAPAAPARN